MALSALLTGRPGLDGRVWRVVRLDALLGIFITGLVLAAGFRYPERRLAVTPD